MDLLLGAQAHLVSDPATGFHRPLFEARTCLWERFGSRSQVPDPFEWQEEVYGCGSKIGAQNGIVVSGNVLKPAVLW